LVEAETPASTATDMEFVWDLVPGTDRLAEEMTAFVQKNINLA